MDTSKRWTCEWTTDGLSVMIRASGSNIGSVDSWHVARDIIAAHNATLEPDKPTEPSILEQEWEYEGHNERVLYGDDEFIFHKDSQLPVETQKWLREIAACPDAYRALVKARRRLRQLLGTDGIAGSGTYKDIDAALKKARIE